jgi:hypothetical protein
VERVGQPQASTSPFTPNKAFNLTGRHDATPSHTSFEAAGKLTCAFASFVSGASP